MLVKEIDRAACDKCGKCARICANSRVITMCDDGYPRFERYASCIHCGHCLAICPRNAITFELTEDSGSGSYVAAARDFEAGSDGPASLLRTLEATRSCRFFDGKAVERAKLERILETMARAPSSGNEQNRNFYVLGEKSAVDGLDADVAGSFRKTNAAMANPLAMRLAIAAMAGMDYGRVWMRDRALADMPKAERKAAAKVLLENVAKKIANPDERYFFHSPAAFIVTSRTNAGAFHKAFYKADVEIAVTYGTLAASALGLSSCRMGLAEIAFGRDKGLRAKYGIPANERVDGILALGYSALEWKRLPPRGPVKVSWL